MNTLLFLAETSAQNQVWINVLVTLIVAILTTGTSYLVTFLKKKAAASKDDALIGAALDLIADVVDATSQTVVDDLKKKGDFTAEKGKEVKEDVVKTIKEQLTADKIKAIQDKYGLDIDVYLRNKVEAVLANNKKK